MWDLTETEEKILRVLARKGVKTYYDIFKKEKLCSPSTAWKLLKKLQKIDYIEVKKEEAFRFRGRKKKLYGLTLKGLIATLRKKEGWEFIHEIASWQEELLPLIFGKWRHFKTHVGEEKLIEALKRLWLPASSAMVFWGFNEPSIVKVIMEHLSAYILSVRVDHKERIGWLKAIHGDLELRQWFLEEKGRYRALSDLWDLSFKYVQKPTPNWDKALEELQIHAPIDVNIG